jgi:hypothetical protein
MQNERMSKPVLIWLMGALVMSLACMGQRDDGPGDQDTGAPDTGTPDSAQPDAGEEGTWLLSVTDQNLDNLFKNRISIQSVEVSSPGWVVVYADDAGAPGEVLGHAAVSPGISLALTVLLSREIAGDEQLHAALHEDLGVEGTLELDGADVPAPGAAGDPTQNTFTVSVPLTPVVEVDDQHVGTVPPDGAITITRHAVTVGSVTSPGDGWVVIYDGAGGVPGDVLGHAPVSAGTSSGVVVPMGRGLLHAEELFAALHEDAGTTGDFEYPGADAPVTRPGTTDVLAEPFTVFTPSLTAPEQVAGLSAASPPAHTVLVTDVRSGGKGWVVVYDMRAGIINDVLGHAPVGPDGATGADVTVEVSRPLVSGETLQVVLHDDLGTPDTFEFPGADLPRVGHGDLPIQAELVAEPPAVTFPDPNDPASLHELVVERVASPADAWLTARTVDEGGGPGVLLGYVQVTPGVHDDLALPITARPLIRNEEVRVELNAENGTVGQFDGTETPMLDTAGEPLGKVAKVRVTGDLGPSLYAVDQPFVATPNNAFAVGEVTIRQIVWDMNSRVHYRVFSQDPTTPGATSIGGAQSSGSIVRVDQTIGVSETLSTGDTVWIVFFEDTLANAEFDEGQDQPVAAGDPAYFTTFEIIDP